LAGVEDHRFACSNRKYDIHRPYEKKTHPQPVPLPDENEVSNMAPCPADQNIEVMISLDCSLDAELPGISRGDIPGFNRPH
jgi:hypothetical protein